ncbi:hypothetical protein CHARACLAT_006552 [Characodon lateralis]|uniref:Uncharacterized protein n=1 Tax=Characodon lateralis TaxID=208331 RepID=A0ABU7D4L9_9TELE|nr:hypothetical protein [Characodon lateralis]
MRSEIAALMENHLQSVHRRTQTHPDEGNVQPAPTNTHVLLMGCHDNSLPLPVRQDGSQSLYGKCNPVESFRPHLLFTLKPPPPVPPGIINTSHHNHWLPLI